YDSALWPMSAGACTRFWKRADVFQLRAAMKSPRRCGSSKSSGGERVPSNWPSTCSKKGGAEDERRPRKMSRRISPCLRLARVRRARHVRGTVLPIDGGYLTCPAGSRRREVIMKDVKGKVAVVTGAASGIGRGMCETFVQAGMRVVLSDVEEKALA